MGNMIFAIFIFHIFEYLGTSFVIKVYVDIGHRNTVGI